MIELHLIGYTADLGGLVLDLAGSDDGQYRVVVDEDLFATIDELREGRRAAGLPVGDLVEFADEGLIARLLDEHQAAAASQETEPEPEPVPQPEPEPEPVLEPQPVLATQPSAPPAPEVRSIAVPSQPTLSPAEIQARLRHGKSVRSVAREAGVDEAWIRRWEAPIVAEQDRMRERALATRLHRARLGSSAQSLGDAVAHNLSRRGVDLDQITWEVSRRRDGRWRVVVRYPSRGRKRSATWLYTPGDGTIAAASDGARELGYTRRG